METERRRENERESERYYGEMEKERRREKERESERLAGA
jgi:hypothetical protein